MGGFMATPSNFGTCSQCGQRIPLDQEGRLVAHGTLGDEAQVCSGSHHMDRDRPVCPLTVGDVGHLYNDYVILLNLDGAGIPLWEHLTPEQQAQVVELAARLLYVEGGAISATFTDAFHDRLGTFLEESP